MKTLNKLLTATVLSAFLIAPTFASTDDQSMCPSVDVVKGTSLSTVTTTWQGFMKNLVASMQITHPGKGLAKYVYNVEGYTNQGANHKIVVKNVHAGSEDEAMQLASDVVKNIHGSNNSNSNYIKGLEQCQYHGAGGSKVIATQ